MEFGLWGGDRVVEGSVVCAGVALSEVVGLDRSGSSSKPFPINLIQVIRLHHETADDTGARCCLGDNSDFSEKDVEITGDCWCLSLLAHYEAGAIC